MIFVRQLYAAIGQKDTVADMAAQYVWITLPGMFFYFHAITLQLFCNAHKVLYYAPIAMTGAAIMHGAILGIFCAYDMQFLGVCVASSVQFGARFVIMWLLFTYGGKFNGPEV